MKEVSWPYFDPEFENLTEKIFGSSCRVWIDNECCEKCTVVKVDSINQQELLLEVVQVLTDMDLCIFKSYISSDGGWSIDVFHVRNQLGNKVTNQRAISYLQQAISAKRDLQKLEYVNTFSGNLFRTKSANDCTAIEMIGTNCPGLFSEISAVLADLKCNIVEAHAWSHNACLACVAYISDESNSTCINDPRRLAAIEDQLSTVLRPDGSSEEEHGSVKTSLADCGSSTADAEHRLHQLMSANRDFDEQNRFPISPSSVTSMACDEQRRKPEISIDTCNEKRYSVVNVDYMDMPKLMFDTLCALTDMQYVVFHACTTSHGPFSHQEYYIRDMNGCTISTQN